MTPHPNALIESAKSGCGNARGKLLEAYRGYLKTLVRIELYRGLAAKADPSDLVQEVFLRAHEGFDGFRGSSDAELSVWLRAILATRMSKFHRHHSAQKRNHELECRITSRLDESSVLLANVAQLGSTPSEVASNRERHLIIANAIDKLPEDYRTVVILRCVSGLPYATVAENMGRSVDSVKKLWVRALAQLKRCVEL